MANHDLPGPHRDWLGRGWLVGIGTIIVAVTLSAGFVGAGSLDHLGLLNPTAATSVEDAGIVALVVSWIGGHRRWWTRTAPILLTAVLALVGAVAAGLRLTGTVTDHYPPVFALWVGLGFLALTAAPLGWHRPGRAGSTAVLRRLTAIVAVPLTMAGAFRTSTTSTACGHTWAIFLAAAPRSVRLS